MHAFMVAVWDLHWYSTDTSVFLSFFWEYCRLLNIVQGGLETLHRSDEFLHYFTDFW